MGFLLAWLAGEGIVTWRWAKAGAPPTPGALAAASGFFVLLALLHEYPPARGAATLAAFGIDIAALLQILPGTNPAQVTGWPPPLINDPSVLLPAGSSGAGQTLAEGSTAQTATGSKSSGGTPLGKIASDAWDAIKP